MAPRRVLLPSPLQHSTRKPNGMSNTIELEVSPLAAGTAGLASRRGSSTDPLTWDLGNGTGMRAVARIERRMKGARPTRLDVYLTRRLGRDETLAQAAGYDDGGPADLLPCRGLPSRPGGGTPLRAVVGPGGGPIWFSRWETVPAGSSPSEATALLSIYWSRANSDQPEVPSSKGSGRGLGLSVGPSVTQREPADMRAAWSQFAFEAIATVEDAPLPEPARLGQLYERASVRFKLPRHGWSLRKYVRRALTKGQEAQTREHASPSVGESVDEEAQTDARLVRTDRGESGAATWSPDAEALLKRMIDNPTRRDAALLRRHLESLDPMDRAVAIDRLEAMRRGKGTARD